MNRVLAATILLAMALPASAADATVFDVTYNGYEIGSERGPLPGPVTASFSFDTDALPYDVVPVTEDPSSFYTSQDYAGIGDFLFTTSQGTLTFDPTQYFITVADTIGKDPANPNRYDVLIAQSLDYPTVSVTIPLGDILGPFPATALPDAAFANLPATTQNNFSNANPGSRGVASAVADVASVPEPASWAMMIVGLGAVGAALRLRRRKGGVAGDIVFG